MKYGIIGYSGRMGKEIEQVFSDADHELVFTYDLNGEKKKEKPELLVDFSLPEAFSHTLGYIEEMQIPLVIGTTALSEKDIEALRKLSKQVPIVQSFNFSVGIQMLLKAVDFLQDHLKNWDVEITETHHRFKKDKPSGTAKMIAEVFPKPVNTTALRLGNVPGDHSVHFGGLGEVISVSHRALSRRTFAEGVLASANFVEGKSGGFFTFTDVLFSK